MKILRHIHLTQEIIRGSFLRYLKGGRFVAFLVFLVGNKVLAVLVLLMVTIRKTLLCTGNIFNNVFAESLIVCR